MEIAGKKVVVIGCGISGRAASFLLKQRGARVYVSDSGSSPEITKTADELREAGIATEVGIHTEACIKDADLVVEAVTEDLETKREVFKEMGENAPAKTVFASNSSSIPISRMEEPSGRPEGCMNIHFYLPLQGMNMVDLMPGTKTSPEVMQKGEEWIRSIGFVPLRVKKEILGFCFNCVWRAIKKQALYMWANDFVDFRDIDRAWSIFSGMKVGPFALMDTVGLDTVYNIEMVYYDDSKDPRDKPPDALKEMIEKGELGVKSGKGFYTYPNPEFLEPDFLSPGSTSKLSNQGTP